MMARRGSRLVWLVAATMSIGAAIAGSARAQAVPNVQNNSVSLTLDGNTGGLLPPAGGAPSFHMNFLLDDPKRMSATEIGTTRDLEISLTAPDNSVFRFMFSPRPQFGVGFDPISGTNRAYAGLTWDLFSANSLYGHFGMATSFDPGVGGIETHRSDEAPLMFHGALEFGYRLDQQNSLQFAIDQGLSPASRGFGPEAVDNFTLRFGRKF